MRDAAAVDRVRERPRDVVLPDEVLERLRPVLASEDEVAHRLALTTRGRGMRESGVALLRDACSPQALAQPWALSSLTSSGTATKRSGDEAVVGDLEDRRVGVLVDRDDDLRALHAGEVLDGARDADRDVELRRDGAPRLTDLELAAARSPRRTPRGSRRSRRRGRRRAARGPALNCSLRARPPETTTRASPRSGRSLLPTSSETNSTRAAAGSSPARATVSTGLAPPDGSAAVNSLCRTLTTWTGVAISSQAKALPAYVGPAVEALAAVDLHAR